ncbi:MAG: SDR family oxidoreductase [Firmicutes bacterium]|nr:SDR family oxidoreductase [Bacillota bacterium]
MVNELEAYTETLQNAKEGLIMALESQRLAGQVAIVTGAASGLDRGIALKLALNGAVVACADINDEENQKTVDMITAAGGQAFPVHVDISNSQSVKAMMKYVYEKMGKITILVNGAAIIKFSPIEECSDEEWEQVIKVDLTGYFYCLREVYPYMKASGGGRIVQISSSSAKSGSSFGGPHYTAAKGGVISLTKYAARRWAKDNILVNTICPGIADTPLGRHPEAPKGAFEEMKKNIPLGRVAEPEDIAGGVLFLVSDEARYITGITLDINGGRYIYGN